jgi:hypothetical protein
MKILMAVLMVLTMASLSSAQQPQTSADVIFINGDIYPAANTTFVWASAFEKPHLPGRAKALAVANGSIIAVGSNDDIQKLKDPGHRSWRTLCDARLQ